MKTPKLKTKLLRMFRKRFYLIPFGENWALTDNKNLEVISSIPYSGGEPFRTRQRAIYFGMSQLMGVWEWFTYYKIRKQRQYRQEMRKIQNSRIA